MIIAINWLAAIVAMESDFEILFGRWTNHLPLLSERKARTMKQTTRRIGLWLWAFAVMYAFSATQVAAFDNCRADRTACLNGCRSQGLIARECQKACVDRARDCERENAAEASVARATPSWPSSAVQSLYAGPPRWPLGNFVFESAAAAVLNHSLASPLGWPLKSESTQERPAQPGRRSTGVPATQWRVCEYAAPQSTASVSMFFWDQGRRLALPADSAIALYGKEVDIELAQCPTTLGIAWSLADGQPPAVRYAEAEARQRSRRTEQVAHSSVGQAALAVAAHGNALSAGLRFASPYFGELPFDNTEAELLQSSVEDVERLLSDNGQRSAFGGDVRVLGADRPPAISRDLESLRTARQQILRCRYDGDSLQKTFGARWILVGFWYGSRPQSITPATAAWFEQAALPLVDVVQAECPPYAGHALALAQGTKGERAQRILTTSRLTMMAKQEPERPVCARLLGVPLETQSTSTGRREPGEFEMCLASFRYHQIGVRRGVDELLSFRKKGCTAQGADWVCTFRESVRYTNTFPWLHLRGASGKPYDEEGRFEWKAPKWRIAEFSTLEGQRYWQHQTEYNACETGYRQRHFGDSQALSDSLKLAAACGPMPQIVP